MTLRTLALLLVAAPVSAQVQYTVTAVPTLGGTNSRAFGVNDAGQVAGYADVTSSIAHAFRFDAGTGIADLGTLGGTSSFAVGINTAGTVVGYGAITGLTPQHGFRAAPGQPLQDVGTLPGGAVSNANGINAAGQLTGQSQFAGGAAADVRAFRCDSGTTLTDLGTLGGTRSYGRAINATGQVTGESNFTGSTVNQFHAFRSTGNGVAVTLTDLGTLGGVSSLGRAINTSGQVAGYSQTAGGATHAFVSDTGTTLTDLGTLGGSSSFAQGINDAGVVVGYSQIASAANRAFLWDGTTMTDLNGLIDPTSGWVLTNAQAISNTGYIAGYGTFGGATRGFLLTPVPEPGTLALLAAAGVAGWWRQRVR